MNIIHGIKQIIDVFIKYSIPDLTSMCSFNNFHSSGKAFR